MFISSYTLANWSKQMKKKMLQLWNASCCPFAVILSTDAKSALLSAHFIHLLHNVAATFNILFIELASLLRPPTQLTGNPLASTVVSYVLNIF